MPTYVQTGLFHLKSVEYRRARRTELEPSKLSCNFEVKRADFEVLHGHVTFIKGNKHALYASHCTSTSLSRQFRQLITSNNILHLSQMDFTWRNAD